MNLRRQFFIAPNFDQGLVVKKKKKKVQGLLFKKQENMVLKLLSYQTSSLSLQSVPLSLSLLVSLEQKLCLSPLCIYHNSDYA